MFIDVVLEKAVLSLCLVWSTSLLLVWRQRPLKYKCGGGTIINKLLFVLKLYSAMNYNDIIISNNKLDKVVIDLSRFEPQFAT